MSEPIKLDLIADTVYSPPLVSLWIHQSHQRLKSPSQYQTFTVFLWRFSSPTVPPQPPLQGFVPDILLPPRVAPAMHSGGPGGFCLPSLIPCGVQAVTGCVDGIMLCFYRFNSKVFYQFNPCNSTFTSAFHQKIRAH